MSGTGKELLERPAGPRRLPRRRGITDAGHLSTKKPSIGLFLLVTVIMGGWAAWMTGRAIADHLAAVLEPCCSIC